MSSKQPLPLPLPPAPAPAPATPTRQLLKRIQRRSSLLPPTTAPPASTEADATHKRRISLQLDSRQHDALHETDENANASQEDVFEEMSDLLETVHSQHRTILDLEMRNKQLQTQLDMEKERANTLKAHYERGLTRINTHKVEREFTSQEMILNGLQRDNEHKTVEVENLRRRLKTLTEFLSRHFGENDWQSLVSGSASASGSTRTSLPPPSPHKEAGQLHDPFARPSALAKVLFNSSPSVAFQPQPQPQPSPAPKGNNDDVVIPTLAHLGSPNKHLAPAASGRFESTPATAPAPAPVPDVDLNTLLAFTESVRLMVQGMERRNAMKMSALEDMADKATLAEDKLEELKQSVAVAS